MGIKELLGFSKPQQINATDAQLLNKMYNQVAAGVADLERGRQAKRRIMGNDLTPSNLKTAQMIGNQLPENLRQIMMGNLNYGYQNYMQGVGGPNDFATQDFRTQAPYLSYNILDNYYRTSWVAKNIIDIPAKDMCRTWRKFKHENSAVIEKREDAEKYYGIQNLIQEVVQWADLYGGAGVVWSLDTDTPESIGEVNPIRKIAKGSLQFFQVVIKDQAMPSGEYYLDPFMSNYLKPDFYTIASTAAANRVHNSRIVIFSGTPLPIYSKLSNVLWGDSKLTPLLILIDRVESMWRSIDQLFAAANVDIMKLKDYASILAKTPQKIRERLGLDQSTISNWNTLLMDSEDEFERKELGSLTGLAEVLKVMLQMLAGAAEIPFTRFLSEGVKGFSDGDNDMTIWYEHLKKKRENMRPMLEKIDRIIEMSVFGKVMDIEYEWIDLAEPDESEIADIEIKKAQRDQVYYDMGIVSPRDIATKLMVEGTYPTITPDRIETYDDTLKDPEEFLGGDPFGDDSNDNNEGDDGKDPTTDKG